MSGTQVHVHLFYGADPRRYRKGENIGSLYGYHHAESAEFALNYAQDASESTPVRVMRRGLKAAFGFDFIHAWRNRRAILQSDVIWTHTEQEHLAVALVLLMSAKKGGARPLLPPSHWKPHTPVRVAAIGNDRDRDWTTLVSALGNDSRYQVRIATRRRMPASARAENVEIVRVSGIQQQHALYDWADLIVVPLRPNTHASGITVMLEAAALGKPMIATKVGALEDYFDEKAASYVEPFNPQQLRDAANALVADPARALEQAREACEQLRTRDLTTQHFARQHAQLTREMLHARDALDGESIASEPRGRSVAARGM